MIFDNELMINVYRQADMYRSRLHKNCTDGKSFLYIIKSYKLNYTISTNYNKIVSRSLKIIQKYSEC